MDSYGSITLALLSLIAITLAPAAQAQVGALDVTFDGDGIRTDSLSLSNVAGDVAVQSDGDIIVFGRSENPSNVSTRDGWVTIYRPDGLDERQLGARAPSVRLRQRAELLLDGPRHAERHHLRRRCFTGWLLGRNE